MKSMVGHAAAPFSLDSIQGDHYSLADFSGHWLLLVFHRHLG